MIIYFVFKFDWKSIYAYVIGLIIGVGFFLIPMVLKYSLSGMIEFLGLGGVKLYNISLESPFMYDVIDLFMVPIVNKINTPVGVGFIMMTLSVLGIFFIFKYKLYKSAAHKILIFWFIVTFLNVFSLYLPTKIYPHGWWVFFTIPLCLLCGETFYKIFNNKIIFLIFVFGILATSAYPKVLINSTPWPPSTGLSEDGMIDGHIWLRDNLPPDTRVFSFVSGNKLQGFNMFFCEWCEQEKTLQEIFAVMTPYEIYFELDKRGYRYLIMNNWYTDQYGGNETFMQFKRITNSGYFEEAYSNPKFVVAKLRDSIVIKGDPYEQRQVR